MERVVLLCLVEVSVVLRATVAVSIELEPMHWMRFKTDQLSIAMLRYPCAVIIAHIIYFSFLLSPT